MVRLLFIILCVLSFNCFANERNDIPNCYQYSHLQQFQPHAQGRELVILIDQTVHVPTSIKQNIWEKVVRWAQPGDHIILYQFSALLKDKYLQRVYDGTLAPLLTDKSIRDNLGLDSLKQLDQCLIEQKQFFAKQIGQTMAKSYSIDGDNIAKSEIINSLQQVNQDIKNHPQQLNRRYLVISDMLENSDFDSFYRNNAIRNLSPDMEMKQISSLELTTDFEGSPIYVVGAGLIASQHGNNYRSGKIMQNLEKFWSKWMTNSNGKLVYFGAPDLNIDLQ